MKKSKKSTSFTEGKTRPNHTTKPIVDPKPLAGKTKPPLPKVKNN